MLWIRLGFAPPPASLDDLCYYSVYVESGDCSSRYEPQATRILSQDFGRQSQTEFFYCRRSQMRDDVFA